MKINQPPVPWVPPASPGSGGYATTLVRVDEKTLHQVADRLRVLIELLLELNPRIPDPNRLSPGMEIRYPVHPFSRDPGAQATAPQAPLATGGLAQAELELARQVESTARQRNLAAGPATPQLASIPPYDPRKGPQITNDMWSEAMLTGDITESQLRNIVDPAGFLNARLAHAQRPTTAKFVNHNGSTTRVNASQLSTREQAEAMLTRLRALGLVGGEVVEPQMANPFSYVDYGDDPRRHFQIGNLNVGLLIERYAKYPKEAADRMTLAELGEARGS
jgi:hypothetical protein